MRLFHLIIAVSLMLGLTLMLGCGSSTPEPEDVPQKEIQLKGKAKKGQDAPVKKIGGFEAS